ncbi:hypothetical protein D3C71_1633090 [compost metagenome]
MKLVVNQEVLLSLKIIDKSQLKRLHLENARNLLLGDAHDIVRFQSDHHLFPHPAKMMLGCMVIAYLLDY